MRTENEGCKNFICANKARVKQAAQFPGHEMGYTAQVLLLQRQVMVAEERLKRQLVGGKEALVSKLPVVVVVGGGGGVGVAKAVGVGAAEVGDTAAKPALCCMGEALVLVFHWLLLVFHKSTCSG